jgi:hypothetical protein
VDREIGMEDEMIRTLESMAESYAELARSRFGVPLDFTVQSLTKLDAYVQSVFPDGCAFEVTIGSIATYVGEVVRRALGGTWQINPGDEPPCVVVGTLRANVFAWAMHVLGPNRDGETFSSKMDALTQLRAERERIV